MKSKFFKLLIASAAVLLLLWLLNESAPIEQGDGESDTRLSVSVIAVKPKMEQTSIRVTGLVNSRFKISLTSNVKGQVTNSFEALVPGQLVKKGDILAQVNDIQYSAALADAKATESNAKLELQRILNRQSVARRIDNGTENNDFRLLKPHVKAAKASLRAAEANVAAALKQLNDTKFRAPFDAVILTKNVAPSQQINIGETVYTLASSKALDVDVSLSSQQWQRVNINSDTTAQVQGKFTANIRYLAPVLNSKTRQRGVVLAIDNPYEVQQGLLPEQQVEVVFASKRISNAVITPATALTRDNKVWTVVNNKLLLEQVTVIDESADSVMFKFVDKPSVARQVVRYPLSTMLVGQMVKADLAHSLLGE